MVRDEKWRDMCLHHGPTMETSMRKRDSAVTLPPKQKRRRFSQEVRGEVPIVDGNCRIIGWTSTAPTTVDAAVRHPDAEKLAGGPVTCGYVQITDKEAARRAGAPADWSEPWRCLAIISESGAQSLRSDGAPLTAVAP